MSFDEATTVFCDENARVIFDPDSSFKEDRYLILGTSELSRWLLVCHVYRRNEEEVVDYFKDLAKEAGIPYQSLINLYLQDCVKSRRKLSLEWVK
ncbi:BrnT family toxin [Nodosilinea sp. LEGE 07298]|nr:BrnT family toxin [Nodosilinea sp. LEGE 07298]